MASADKSKKSVSKKSSEAVAVVRRKIAKSKEHGFAIVHFDGQARLLVDYDGKRAWFANERAHHYSRMNNLPTENYPGVFWQAWCQERGITWHERDIEEGELS